MFVSDSILCSGEGRSNAATAPAFAGAHPCEGESGFTLVELMVVIVILGLLATIVAINVLPALGKGNAAKAKTDIATLEQALEMYRLDNLTYPSSTEGLQALVAPPPGAGQPQRYRQGGYVRRLPEDPWGNPYQYRRQSAHGGQFDVFSYGADGQEGGEGNDADIGNWQS
jgi:general secretion pathway protein G